MEVDRMVGAVLRVEETDYDATLRPQQGSTRVLRIVTAEPDRLALRRLPE